MIPHVASFPLAAPLLARGVNWQLDLDLLLRGAGKAVIVLVVAYLARWALHRLSRRFALRAQVGDPATVGARAQRAATLAQLVNEVGLIVIVIVAGLLILDIFINIGPLLAGAGVLGLAASLGGQALMKDIVSGFVIVFEDQYVVGERVRLGDVEGTVQQLTLRSTVIRADDGTLHFVPNGNGTPVANLSRRNAGRTAR
ncbi:MAG: mechanosensitive ion channel domain-containing protein [Gemmatimonadales bacterium]